MKILALDLASQTGIAVGRSGEPPRCWSISLGDAPQRRGGMSKAEKLTLERKRLYNACKMATGLIKRHEPDLIIVEAAIGGKNASSYLQKLVGCVEAVSFGHGVKLELVYPATVRKAFMGKAKTSRDFPGMTQAKAKLEIKREIQRMCLAYGWNVPDLDAADAAACWEWGCANHVPGHQLRPTGGLFRDV